MKRTAGNVTGFVAKVFLIVDQNTREEKEDYSIFQKIRAEGIRLEARDSLMKVDPKKIEVVDDQMAEVLRNKTPAERLRIGFNMWISTRRMLLSHLSNTHPEWSREEVEREVARRLLHGS
jgi:hypothetical protein